MNETVHQDRDLRSSITYAGRVGKYVPNPWLGLVVTYGNGHGVAEQDRILSIAASFGWRMLHRMFVDGNSKDLASSQWTSEGFLPSNADALTIPLVLKVVCALAQQFDLIMEGDILSLFIGIDEYQAIPKGAEYERREQQIDQNDDDAATQLNKIRALSYLWKLIGTFDTCRAINTVHMKIYLLDHIL